MEFDVIVYGATGFTGSLAARFLSRKGKQLQIAIAGRSASKLEAIAQSCERPPAIVIADSTRPDSVHSMVERGRVIASFAGPFSVYGEPVIEACARLGRHYCDITGETPWVKGMIRRYHEEALRTGACLIPFAGFDSVPAELTSYLALDDARRQGLTLDSMTHFYSLKGGLNGGTLASALAMAEQGGGRDLYNPNVLVPDPQFPRGARPQLGPRYEPLLQRWSSAFFMGPINTAVVRRSMYLRSLQAGGLPPFDYEERLLFGDAWQGRLGASGMTLGLSGFALMTRNRLGRQLLKRIGPEPGEGPSEELRKSSFYRGKLIASSRNEPKILVTFECPLDPGNEATITFAATIAQLLAEGAQGNAKGFSTPSVALGQALVNRLQEGPCKLGIQTISKQPI